MFLHAMRQGLHGIHKEVLQRFTGGLDVNKYPLGVQ